MFSLGLPRRLASFAAIAIAVVCAGKSAHAGVITESSWSDQALVASASLPADAPQREALSDHAHGGMEGVLVSSSGGGGPTAGIASGLVQLADASVTGRVTVSDRLLPEDPYLDGLPKPA